MVLLVAERNARFALLEEEFRAVETPLEETEMQTRVSRFVLLIDVAALID